MQRFDEYMEHALYGPDGFYSSGRGVAGGGAAGRGAAGRRGGDFITSPEVGPLFGALVAKAANDRWVALGRPDDYRVIDAGTGPGTLLRSLAHAAPECSRVWELIGVDRATGVSMPENLTNSFVVANELLDNLVFRIVEKADSGWFEVYVKDTDGSFADVLVPCEDPAVHAAVGQRVPLLSTASSWIRDVLDRGADELLIFDYGEHTTAELGNRGGWLRTYAQHQRGEDPLREPGWWDITTDIAVDQLPEPATVMRQAGWLERQGIQELVEEGRIYWDKHAATPNLAAFRMRSRINEAAALTDPNGLGSWLVLGYEGTHSS